ncbi:TolB family protein [Actinomadura oligospora]|uniref:TolB family protein n=1 Tax=Actinomadura oligospora TaxID=111804 RepID=UPI000479D804|nr:hypothetical protein [Actinomadura oligospora]
MSVGVLVIAAAGTSLGVEIRREPARHRPVASPSPRPVAGVAGRRPAPGPVRIKGRRIAEVVSEPPGTLTMTSFSLPGERDLMDIAAFVLDPATGTFVATPYAEAAVSPDGRTVAGTVNASKKSSQVAVRDRRTGAERRVSLPSSSGYPKWAPRGRRILVSLYSRTVNDGLRGFAVIDADTLRVRITSVTGKGRPARVQPAAEFAWDATGAGVVAPGKGSRLIRFPANGGKAGPDVPLTEFYDAQEILYSPSGRMLACSNLHNGTAQTILWDVTGRKPREVRRLPGLMLLGWYDDARLLVARTVDDNRWETTLTGLDGTVRQILVRDSVPGPGPGVMGRYSAIPRS